jgi:predicted O-methyltransferase YrrM
LAHKINPIRLSSTDAAKVFNKKIDFLFIDADHTYDAVYNDIMNWYPKLSKKGVICGDDWHWLNVRAAVVDAAAVLNISVNAVPNAANFWKMNREQSYQSTLPEPFRSAKLLPFDDRGSVNYPNELKAEVKNVADAGGKVFIEHGSGLGKSTRIIASSLPHGIKVIAIDTWKKYRRADEVEKDPNIPKLYESFLSNCIIKGFAHKIYPIKSTTDEAVKKIKNKVDFIFINADHSDAIYDDIMKWYPKLSKKGVIYGNDWTLKNLSSAVTNVAAAINKTVNVVPNTNFWKII